MTFGYQCDEKTPFAIMSKAAELGVYFIDTADVYPVPPSLESAGRTAEEIVGRWLKGQRDRFVLATKCRMKGWGRTTRGLSRRHQIKAVDDSLRRLQTDYIDLYQPHSFDSETPLAKRAARASTTASGKAKSGYLGCSNYPAWQTHALAVGIVARHGLAGYDCVQPRYNLLHRDIETELLPLCRDQGIGVIAYNPLAGGFLTGKYQSLEAPPEKTRFSLGKTGDLYRERYWQQAQLEAVQALHKPLFSRRGKSLIGVAVAWVLGRSPASRRPCRRSEQAGAASTQALPQSTSRWMRKRKMPAIAPGIICRGRWCRRSKDTSHVDLSELWRNARRSIPRMLEVCRRA